MNFDETFQLSFTLPEDDHTVLWSCSSDFLPELWSFGKFSTVSLVFASPLAVDFNDTFK